jgi:hypothetical protein
MYLDFSRLCLLYRRSGASSLIPLNPRRDTHSIRASRLPLPPTSTSHRHPGYIVVIVSLSLHARILAETPIVIMPKARYASVVRKRMLLASRRSGRVPARWSSRRHVHTPWRRERRHRPGWRATRWWESEGRHSLRWTATHVW